MAQRQELRVVHCLGVWRQHDNCQGGSFGGSRHGCYEFFGSRRDSGWSKQIDFDSGCEPFWLKPFLFKHGIDYFVL